MQGTQKQSIREERICLARERIATLPAQIDNLIEGYRIMRKLRPEYAREYLESIEGAISTLKMYERDLASLEANPDCPF